jgi:hypothetical protein
MIYRRLAASVLLLAACNTYPEMEDVADVCVYAREIDGQNRLLAYARINNCAADHKGAYLKCTITVTEQDAHIQTVYKDGKDPNHACHGPLEGSCEAIVEPGDYALAYDGDQQSITVPGGDYVCFGADPNTGTE